MKERIIIGFDSFVIPFMVGMIFILAYCIIGLVRIICRLEPSDRKRLFISLVTPKTILKNIRDIICDCLLHVKIFRRNLMLGYMHASIAFGWFMLIVIGHIEVWLYTPHRQGLLYYPVFFRYFVKETNHTLKGAFFFFLMDLFLLMVLSGIGIAMFKRIRSSIVGMRRTTRASLTDTIAMYALWAIFPLRLLAESFTAGISGGGFLTKPMYWLFHNFLSKDYHILPTWWAYSIALGIFFFMLPFSRYMHIPTEAVLIVFRNAGIKIRHPRKGYSELQIYSCSSCGICIDACPMVTHKKNIKYSSVYFMRFLRRKNRKKTREIADKCLMCGKCVAICPVGVDSCELKRKFRNADKALPARNYDLLEVSEEKKPAEKDKILYYAGCMTQLTPSIYKSMEKILGAAGADYEFLDREGGICCGRPLLLSGNEEAAAELIRKNTEAIMNSGAGTLLLSCPICYKVFRENYDLKGIRIMHHTVYIDNLIKEGKISVKNSGKNLVYHDPCELGRGSGIYDEPRNTISMIGNLKEAAENRKSSICCGGSLGSLTLSSEDRAAVTKHSLKNLTYMNPEEIITACPLCLKTFGTYSEIPVKDIATAVAGNITCKNKKDKE